MTVELQAARPLIFVRALARVMTNHPDIMSAHRRKRSFARLMGEVVSLLALIYITERTKNPWGPLLSVIFAFLIPTIVFSDNALSNFAKRMGARYTVLNNAYIGAAGVLVCFVVNEALLTLMDHFKKVDAPPPPPPKPREVVKRKTAQAPHASPMGEQFGENVDTSMAEFTYN